MKQVVIFSVDDLESMRSDVNDALYYINKKKPMNYDDCKIRDNLEDIQKVLYKEDDQNEE